MNTQVGYGHVVPKTDAGRVFAVLFMLVGISCEVALFSGIAMLPIHKYRREMERRLLEQIEATPHKELGTLSPPALGLSESDEYVTRDEFCLATLVRLEKISADDLRTCQEAFSKLDVHGRGWIGVNSADSTKGSGGAGTRNPPMLAGMTPRAITMD